MASKTQPVEYRGIAGFPGYRVGSDGSVWSSWFRKPLMNGKRGGSVSVSGGRWRRLTPTLEKRQGRTRHYHIMLKGHGRCRSFYIHSLVLRAFVGDRAARQECRHVDGVPKNNRLQNLIWGTRKQNVADQFAHGAFAVGIRHGNAKLTDRQVRMIRVAKGTQEEIAERFGIVRQTVSAIRLKRARKFVK